MTIRPSHPVVVKVAKDKAAYQLDQPLLHTDLKWPFTCGLCGQVGHHFMECGGPGLPAKVKRQGVEEEIITLKQLYKMKFADKFGNKA